jgi:hypothetical protein
MCSRGIFTGKSFIDAHVWAGIIHIPLEDTDSEFHREIYCSCLPITMTCSEWDMRFCSFINLFVGHSTLEKTAVADFEQRLLLYRDSSSLAKSMQSISSLVSQSSIIRPLRTLPFRIANISNLKTKYFAIFS